MKTTRELAYYFAMFFLVCVGIVTCRALTSGAHHVVKSIDNAVVNYDNFQETYNTCVKLNTDLGILMETPDEDKQFQDFTKFQRINALKMNLIKNVEDYNARSREIDKNLWKSSALPCQLSVHDFSNFDK